LVIALAFLGAGSAIGAQGPDALRKGSEVLEAAARAYRQVPALRDTLTYTVKTPSATLPPKALDIRLGAGRDVAVKDPLFEAIAVEGTLYLTKSDAPGKYVARPYSGDFAKTLDASPGLPSLVIAAADGTVFKYHQGLFPEMLETLQKEVREAASKAGR